MLNHMNNNKFRQLARQLKIGQTLYHCLHKPKKEIWLYYSALSAQYGEHNLKNYLKSVETPKFDPIDLNITFMTGANYWHQTSLCALSLIYAIKGVPIFTIYDDGTLDSEKNNLLKKLFPNASIIAKIEAEEYLKKLLPPGDYPALWTARSRFVQMRKLVDINLLSPNNLYLDSDMIFWKYPTELIDLYQSDIPCFMSQHSIEEDLGFICKSKKIYDYTGIHPIQHFNAGIFYLGKNSINWKILETWTSTLMNIPSQFNPVTLEQTLLALFFAGVENAVGLPDTYYVACDNRLPKDFVLTHYVNTAKFKYMSREWQKWLYKFEQGS